MSEHSSTSLLKGATKPALIVSALVVLVSSLFKGSAGFFAGLLASFVVLIFFSVSLLISRLTKNADPITTFSLAMLSYVTKLTLVAVLLIAVTRLTAEATVDRRSFGIGALLISGAWLIGEIRAFLSLRLELDIPPKKEPGEPEKPE
jgi:ATP synthase protein I